MAPSIIEVRIPVPESIDFDLREHVEDCTERLSLLARRRELELILSFHPDADIRMTGHPDRLRQVVLKLGEIAIKSAVKGEIFIRVLRSVTEEREPQILFEIHVPGAATRSSEKIGRADPAFAACRRWVEGMAGTIGIDTSSYAARKCWFTVPAVGARSAPADHRLPESEDLRVLLVDHRASAGEAFGHLFDELSIHYCVCSNVAEALRTLRSSIADARPIDLVILEESVPDADALPVARMLSANPEIERLKIAMTTTSIDRWSEKCSAVDCAILKPVLRDRLLDCLRKLTHLQTRKCTRDV